MSQEEFAQKFGRTRNMITSYENKISEPNIEFLVRLEKATGFSLIKLYEEDIDWKDIPDVPLEGSLDVEIISRVEDIDEDYKIQGSDDLFDYRKLVATVKKIEQQISDKPNKS
jgi:transcriptional regulator with XRE-family HTH domain